MKKVNFAMFIHCHQPVGNFDAVFEQSCNDCYMPLVDMMSQYPEIKCSFHFSGSLLEWIEEHRKDLADKIAGMVQRGQIELMGGGYYEPVLTMLTEEDRRGQILLFTKHLRERYGANVRGAWLTERVWEQSLVTTLADAGIEYTALDDSHFNTAGVPEYALTGSFITEDRGRTIRVFPGSEYLRYIIPFHDVEKTIEFLGSHATEDAKHVITYADDGEKFGIWPKTKKHVYENGWLKRWLDALKANRHWINFVTGSEAIDQQKAAGKIYLPDASYREMMEWALPAATLRELEDLVDDLAELGLDQRAKRFIRGGTWRNFRVKYPEIAQMYAKMMRASRKVNSMPEGPAKEAALRDLYRGQCNCPYWHGVFGGLYLPHLRRGSRKPLILAENAADKAAQKAKNFSTLEVGDFDFDGHDEVTIANEKMRATFKPSIGGHLLEFSSPELGLDFIDTLARRREAYHRKIFKAADQPKAGVQSIHDITVMKEEGLEKLLQYDWFPRRSFMEHVLGPTADLNAFARCDYHEVGDFTIEPFTMTAKTNGPGGPKIVMRRDGGVYLDGGRTPVTVEKVASFDAPEQGVRMNYAITAHEKSISGLRLAIQFNIALVTGGGFGTYYSAGSVKHGDVLERMSIPSADTLELVDENGRFAVKLSMSKAGEVWVFPVQTVSQSESGFERVLQNVAVAFVYPMELQPGAEMKLEAMCAFRKI